MPDEIADPLTVSSVPTVGPENPEVLWPLNTSNPPPCSFNACTAGHTWVPKVQLAVCAGCAAPVLAVKMENCPICNEPVARFALRVDHLPPGPVVRACRGERGSAEISQIEMAKGHAKEIEERP